jgi:hypothetical protein
MATYDERLKILTMYERRTHHEQDLRRVPAVIASEGLTFARCRGSVAVESFNRFGNVSTNEVSRSIRKVHDRINN